MFNFNDYRYPTNEQVIEAVDSQGKWFWPEYEIVGLHGWGETATKFQVKLRHREDSNLILRFGVEVLPNQNGPGYHILSPHLIYAGSAKQPEYDADRITGHGPEFAALRETFPNHRIRFVDNEDDNYPVFGWAAIEVDEPTYVGFIHIKSGDDEVEDYAFNPDLPEGIVITNPRIIARVAEELHYIENLDSLDRY